MMASTRPQIAFVSGHTDLTKDDFDRIYIPHLDSALKDGHSFVVGDAAGVDTFTLTYLLSEASQSEYLNIHERVTVFASRKNNIFKLQAKGVKVIGPECHRVETSSNNFAKLVGAENYGRNAARHRHLVRDTHMTLSSDYDILFVRSDEESKALYGERWRPRISATELNRQRRLEMLHASQGPDT